MIEKLFEAISEKADKFAEHTKMFGRDHWLVQKELQMLNGMEDAFKVIAGCSYTDYLLAKIDEEIKMAI